MIDTKSKIVLKILSKEAKNGNYKIFDLSDIIFSMPKHYRTDKQNLKHILTFLERQDMISIKYDDDDTYCIAVLPYGLDILENSCPKTENETPNGSFFKKCLFCFLSAFFGGILGSLTIFLLIKLAKI